MSVSLGNAHGKITIDASGAKTGSREAGNALSQFSNKVRGVGDVMKGILGAQIIQKLASELINFGKSIVTEAVEAQNVQTQLAAVLKSTGEAAGVTAKMANSLADSLSKTTRFGDEAILSGEAILLTFTKVGEEVFPLATKTALDMSQALGQDLKTSNIQLGKALQDPINGITALRRVGVNFSDSQERMIKRLVQTGKLEAAQTLILQELQAEFGGSAEAAGKTFAGQLDILKNRLGNVKEALGGLALNAFMGMMNRASGPVADLTDAIQELIAGNLPEGMTLLSDSFYGFLNVLGVSGRQVKGILTIFNEFKTSVLSGRGPLDALGGALRHMVPSGVLSGFDSIAGAFRNLGQTFADSLPMIQSYGQDMWGFLVSVMQTVGPVLVGGITQIINTIAQLWQDHGASIMAILNFLWKTIVVIVTIALSILVGVISYSIQLIKAIIDGVALAIQFIIKGVTAVIQADWAGMWTQMVTAVSTAWAAIKGWITTSLATVGLTFQTGLTVVKTTVSTAFNNIIQTIRARIAAFVAVGQAIISALVGAITSGISGVVTAITNLVTSAIETAKEILNINSPSRVFRAFGQGVDEGLELGIADRVPRVLGAVARMARQMMAVPMPTLSPTLVPATANLTAQAASLGQYGGMQRVEINNWAPQYHTYKGTDEEAYRKYYSR